MLVSVSIIFLSKRMGDLFLRPFMNFTDEEFETLKNRYIQKLRYSRNKFLNESRKIETAAQAYGLSYLFTNNLPMDEFSQEVSRVFDWLYEIGKPINEIIDGLYSETRISHLNELKQRPEQRIVKVHKCDGRFNSTQLLRR